VTEQSQKAFPQVHHTTQLMWGHSESALWYSEELQAPSASAVSPQLWDPWNHVPMNTRIYFILFSKQQIEHKKHEVSVI
jgi:hypothetical protein